MELWTATEHEGYCGVTERPTPCRDSYEESVFQMRPKSPRPPPFLNRP